MQFIPMTGKTLRRIVSDDELHPHELDEFEHRIKSETGMEWV